MLCWRECLEVECMVGMWEWRTACGGWDYIVLSCLIDVYMAGWRLDGWMEGSVHHTRLAWGL